MDTLRAILARIQDAFAWWLADIRRRPSLIGKAASLGIGLIIICCVCSVGLGAVRSTGQAVGLMASNTPSPRPTNAPEATDTPVPTVAATATDLPTATAAPTDAPTVAPTTRPAQPTAPGAEPTAVVVATQPTKVPEPTKAPQGIAAPQPTKEPPTAVPEPTEAPVAAAPKPLPTATYNGCRSEPNPGAAPDYPIKIVWIDKRAETVTLKNVSDQAVNLDGWQMCSIKGAQHHPIGGSLAPGEQRVFDGPAGNIWNNSERDPGALYNPNGQLVSYFTS